MTFGRLLLKSTNQNKNKDSKSSSPKSKIRYRLSSKYDFKNLKYGSEESCQNSNDDEETILLTDENCNERSVKLIENQENLKEFEEIKIVQNSIHNNLELNKTVCSLHFFLNQ